MDKQCGEEVKESAERGETSEGWRWMSAVHTGQVLVT